MKAKNSSEWKQSKDRLQKHEDIFSALWEREKWLKGRSEEVYKVSY